MLDKNYAMLNFYLFFPFLPRPKRTFVLYVLEEQSQFDLSMCVLRALFTVCTLPNLICRGLSSITFIYKKRIIYANTCHNVAIHIVISYISSNFTQLTTSKFSKSPQNTIDIFLHPCD